MGNVQTKSKLPPGATQPIVIPIVNPQPPVASPIPTPPPMPLPKSENDVVKSLATNSALLSRSKRYLDKAAQGLNYPLNWHQHVNHISNVLDVARPRLELYLKFAYPSLQGITLARVVHCLMLSHYGLDGGQNLIDPTP